MSPKTSLFCQKMTEKNKVKDAAPPQKENKIKNLLGPISNDLMIHCFTASIKFFSFKEAALKSKGDSVYLCVCV